MRPSEVDVLAVEHLLRRAALVVVEDDLLVLHFPVVGQDASVGVLPVEEVELLALALPLPLYDETAVADPVELLEREGLNLVLLVADLHLRPSRLPPHLLIEGIATLGTDVELLGVGGDHFNDVFAVGAAVCTEDPDLQTEVLHQIEEAAQGLGLHETDVGVAVAVLQVDDVAAYRHHAGTVAEEMLVSELASYFSASMNWWSKSTSYSPPRTNWPVASNSSTSRRFSVSAVLKS